MGQGRLPGRGEGHALGGVAQAIAGADRHADRRRRLLHDAGVGERADEIQLPLRREAVAARLAEHGNPAIAGGIEAMGIQLGLVRLLLGQSSGAGRIKSDRRRGRRGGDEVSPGLVVGRG